MITKITTLILFIILSLQVDANTIHIPQNQLKIIVSHEDKPFSVAGKKFSDSKKAVSLITYIYENWSLKDSPVLVIKSETKALMPGEDFLHEQIKVLSENLKFQVIYMPPPIGDRLPSEDEILKQTNAWIKKKEIEPRKQKK